jgi:hypothetical protein
MNGRFEVMLFLDGVFLMEDEDALLPFTYRTSTRGVTPGRHAVTVNVVDTDGNLGTATSEFAVAGEKERRK